MSNFVSKFNFVGEPIIPKKEAKRPFIKEFKGGKNKNTPMLSLNLGIKASDNNMAFVESFGMVRDTIMTMNSDNEKIEINWKDRSDLEIINSVANYKKFVINLGDDFGGRKEFITEYDMILYLKESLPQYKGKIVITGQMIKEPYQGKYYDKFKIQNVFAVDDDEKSRFNLSMDIYYNKESIDKTDYKIDNKIYLNGYISQYINKDEGSKFIPQQFVFSSAKYDLSKEKHVNLLNYKLKYIETSSKNMVHIPWDVVLIRGAEDVEFDESMLTSAQKEQIELGIKTLDDFKPKGQIYGDKINEYRLFDPQLKGDFADGLVKCDMTTKEFEELIYVPVQDEKLDDVVKNAKEEEVKSKEDDAPPFDIDENTDEEDLF